MGGRGNAGSRATETGNAKIMKNATEEQLRNLQTLNADNPQVLKAIAEELERRKSASRTKSELLKIAQDFATHNLNNGYRTTKVTDAELVSDIDENGMANVKMSYEDHVRVMVGYDVELQKEEWETETEYHTNTLRIKVRK